MVKGLKITGNISKTFAFIVFFIAAIVVIMFLYIKFANLKSRTNIEVVKTMENMYHISVDIISKDIDEKENGIYKLNRKDNKDIQFTAIKKFGNLSEDYSDNCHKYYFDKWENTYKDQFIIIENNKEDILDYDTYIEIRDDTELKNAMNIINSFVNYCGDAFSPNWRIYLKLGDYIIYPYNQSGMTNEEATNNAMQIYKKLMSH